jgi:hypothetical protein
MIIRFMLTAAMLALVAFAARAEHPMFSLYTFSSPPYQYASPRPGDPRVIGETAETIRCAMSMADADVDIRLMPQNRARYSMQRNLVDGYFAVDRSMELDQIALRSHPVALEKWYWFYTGDRPALESARIGVIGGSNEEEWLVRNGIDPYLEVASAEQLPALLKRDRIDVALMDQRVMDSLLESSPQLHDTVNEEFLRYAPLHLYLNRRFSSEHAGVLDHFNSSLPECMKQQLALSDREREQVARTASRLVENLIQNVDLTTAVYSGPTINNLVDVLTQDTLWQALAPQQPTSLALEILALPASRALGRWQSEHDGLVTEVLLTNNIGALVAMSRLSSDYWQGDEPKYQEIANPTEYGIARKSEMWISPIRYDASTSQFQVIVSVPVPANAPDNGLDGVLILGLAIEDVLLNRESIARARRSLSDQGVPTSQASTSAQNSEKSLTTTSGLSGCLWVPGKILFSQGWSHCAPLKNTEVMPARFAAITSVVESPTYQALGSGG